MNVAKVSLDMPEPWQQLRIFRRCLTCAQQQNRQKRQEKNLLHSPTDATQCKIDTSKCRSIVNEIVAEQSQYDLDNQQSHNHCKNTTGIQMGPNGGVSSRGQQPDKTIAENPAKNAGMTVDTTTAIVPGMPS